MSFDFNILNTDKIDLQNIFGTPDYSKCSNPVKLPAKFDNTLNSAMQGTLEEKFSPEGQKSINEFENFKQGLEENFPKPDISTSNETTVKDSKVKLNPVSSGEESSSKNQVVHKEIEATKSYSNSESHLQNSDIVESSVKEVEGKGEKSGNLKNKGKKEIQAKDNIYQGGEYINQYNNLASNIKNSLNYKVAVALKYGLTAKSSQDKSGDNILEGESQKDSSLNLQSSLKDSKLNKPTILNNLDNSEKNLKQSTNKEHKTKITDVFPELFPEGTVVSGDGGLTGSGSTSDKNLKLFLEEVNKTANPNFDKNVILEMLNKITNKNYYGNLIPENDTLLQTSKLAENTAGNILKSGEGSVKMIFQDSKLSEETLSMLKNPSQKAKTIINSQILLNTTEDSDDLKNVKSSIIKMSENLNSNAANSLKNEFIDNSLKSGEFKFSNEDYSIDKIVKIFDDKGKSYKNFFSEMETILNKEDVALPKQSSDKKSSFAMLKDNQALDFMEKLESIAIKHKGKGEFESMGHEKESSLAQKEFFNLAKAQVITENKSDKVFELKNEIPYEKIDIQKIIDQIKDSIKPPYKNEITITLNPENLGKLKIVLLMEGESLNAQITAENKNVQNSLNYNVQQLETALKEKGINLNNFTVTVDNQNNPESSENRNFQDNKKSRDKIVNFDTFDENLSFDDIKDLNEIVTNSNLNIKI